MKIAIIGGTGNLGYGLALRLGNAGHDVVIGSRTAEKAQQAAREGNEALGRSVLTGRDNRSAAEGAEVIILSVPFEAQDATLEAIADAAAGKVVIDATVPLAPGNPTAVAMPPEGSAAERTQRILANSRVVAAFHHVGAKALTRLDKPIDTDVFVCGEDPAAKEVVIALTEALGTRAIDCGPLRQAQALERITPLLIGLNIRHKKRHTGLRLTGL